MSGEPAGAQKQRIAVKNTRPLCEAQDRAGAPSQCNQKHSEHAVPIASLLPPVSPPSPHRLSAALPKGGITPDHVLIIPIAHVGALATAPASLRAEVAAFKSALARMWAARGGRGLVAFERVLHARRGETPQHTHLQVVPLPASLVPSAKGQLVMEGQFRYVPLTELPQPQEAQEGQEGEDPLAAAVALPAPLEGSAPDASFAGSSSAGTVEYFYVEVSTGTASTAPGEAAEGAAQPSAGGEGDGEAAAPGAAPSPLPFARLLHVVPPGAKHPVQFGREVVCRLLCAPDRLSWKACALPTAEEAAQADAFREAFAPFDFTAEL